MKAKTEYSSDENSSSSLKRLHSSSNHKLLIRSKSLNQNLRLVNFIFKPTRRLFLLIPLFYISLLFIYLGGAFSPPSNPLPGSVYRGPQIFAKLWPQIHNTTSKIQFSSVWRYRRRPTEKKSCSNTTGRHTGFSEPSGYLIVEANGGLNQQRSSICNAVAVAWLLNATLVIPQFNFHSIWKDPSGFGDIYDEDHFVNTLEEYVTVVRQLPPDLMERYNYNLSNVSNIAVRGWAPVSYYVQEIYPVLLEQGVIRISPFANRLAMEVPPNIQFLRCLTNYKALRFSDHIATLAKRLIDRMVEKSFKSDGKYVSVHLRFEEDMVAFSCCVYDGGDTEKAEMDSARKKGWGDKFKRKDRIIRPDLNRISGRCPLTPLEVGMMLRGMGFDNNTSIYLASGKIYQAERNLAPLLQMFPLLETKETLLSQEELSLFEGYSSRLAALDYSVCLFSEVFVTTQGGNFPHFVIGHRRFLYGHAKTIKPDKRKLVLLMEDTSISWGNFTKQMGKMLVESDREGARDPNVSKASRRFPVFMYPPHVCRCL
ncbi:O-fucosyltransferase 11 [Ranunculus cassubicifolius]